MERNPYTAAKLALEAKESLREPEQDCGFYAKYFFLFLSLIQFLIILGLVLFMVYGNPQGATEKHVQGLNYLVQNCTARFKAQEKELAGVRRQLNASQGETRQARVQAGVLNATLRACVLEKAKMSDLQKDYGVIRQMAQECTFNLHLLNLSCPVQLAGHQEQLKILQARVKLDQDGFGQRATLLRAQAALAEKEKRDCQLELLQKRTRSEKHQELATQILDRLTPARQRLEEMVKQALVGQTLSSCYHQDIASLRDRCLHLSNSLRDQLEDLSRQVTQQVNEVAEQNGALQRQKETCAYDLQERDHRLAALRDQAEREKGSLREAHLAEVQTLVAERQKLARDKDDLHLQLDQSKKACLQMRNIAPAAIPPFRVPGLATGVHPASAALHPSFYSPPGAMRPNVPAQGNPSIISDGTRLHPRKDTPEGAKLNLQPPSIPGGQPSG